MKTARQRFDLALVDLASRGQRPPCGDAHDLWFSADPAERAIAVDRCTACPVIGLCSDAADEAGELWGVWGGVSRDVERRAGKR